MLNKPSSDLRKATGCDVGTGKVITLTKTQPIQLSLFGEFLPPEARNNYSNTIELYDAIPKYLFQQETHGRAAPGRHLPQIAEKKLSAQRCLLRTGDQTGSPCRQGRM